MLSWLLWFKFCTVFFIVPEVLGSEAVAVTFSTRLYGSMAWVMSVFVACSTFGGVNGTLLTASRLFMVGAREGQMPGLLTCIHVDRATPVPSVIALTTLCLLYLTSRYSPLSLHGARDCIVLFTATSSC